MLLSEILFKKLVAFVHVTTYFRHWRRKLTLWDFLLLEESTFSLWIFYHRKIFFHMWSCKKYIFIKKSKYVSNMDFEERNY